MRTALALTLVLAAAAQAQDGEKPAAPPAEKPAAPAKHENKVTPEAKAAFERIAKAVNGAFRRGMKEASGALVIGLPQGPLRWTFTATPSGVRVEAPAPAEGGGQRGRGMAGNIGRSAENILGYALGVFEPPSDTEYDAEVVERDVNKVLVITRFRDGVQMERRQVSLDDDGVPQGAFITVTMSRGGETRESSTTTVYTWSKQGDSRRLDRIHNKNERGETSVEIAYVDAGGFFVPSAWKVAQGENVLETTIEDLVVDGKAVATKKAEAPAEKPGEEKK